MWRGYRWNGWVYLCHSYDINIPRPRYGQKYSKHQVPQCDDAYVY